MLNSFTMLCSSNFKPQVSECRRAIVNTFVNITILLLCIVTTKRRHNNDIVKIPMTPMCGNHTINVEFIVGVTYLTHYNGLHQLFIVMRIIWNTPYQWWNGQGGCQTLSSMSMEWISKWSSQPHSYTRNYLMENMLTKETSFIINTRNQLW